MSLKPGSSYRSGKFANEKEILPHEMPGLSADAELERRIEALLSEDRRLDATRVVVHVEAGRVLLTGIVLTPDEARYAETCAASIDGVASVINDITSEDGAAPERAL